MAPTVSHAYDLRLLEAKAYPQTKVFEAAPFFARHEGTIPAPEPSHAICAVIEEAVRAREEGKKKVILFSLCGHGLLYLSGYDAYLAEQLRDEL
ncbi:MAG: hypothetical protein NZ483_06420 [Verrucomicrobiae bacterium]|nr:hypothetical protein [Verrucomicrobiae bacterium]